MKKILLILFGISQLFFGLFYIWSAFRVQPPQFTWGKGFFIPAWYVLLFGLTVLMLAGSIKTARKVFGRGNVKTA